MLSPSHHFNLREALAAEIEAARAALDADPRNPKCIHQCRIGLKRARALARVGAVCAPGLAAVFQSTARHAMARLAAARDLAALAETARALAERAGKKRAAALTQVAASLDMERAALPATDLTDARAGLRDLAALAKVWPDASERQIRKGAARVHARAWRAFRRGRGAKAHELRHAWRKREKDALYASALLGDDWPYKRRRKRCEQLGEGLGRERDALILAERVAAKPSLAGTPKNAKRVLKVLEARGKQLARRADRLGASVHIDDH
jgi:CHAD domain-containing protein